MRLDLYLVEKTKLARHQIHKMIQSGGVKVSGEVVLKPAFKVTGTEEVEYQLPTPEVSSLEPQNIPLNILYEDDDIIVVNKAAERVVHPGAGHSSNTLVNALLFHCGSLPEGDEKLKPGIVHRLDKGTSGCLVVAKTSEAMKNLQMQFKNREVDKIYLALVVGKPPKEGRFDKPLGRNPKNRQKISSFTQKGREALTEWKVLETFQDRFSWVEIRLHTGRTHQIRVHFSEAGYPLVGDPTYGRRSKVLNEEISRCALRAWRLTITHPKSQEKKTFEAPLPEDINQLLKKLKKQNIEGGHADSN